MAKTAGELTVVGIDFGDDVGSVGFQRADLRQVAGVNEKKTATGAQGNRAKQEKCEREPGQSASSRASAA